MPKKSTDKSSEQTRQRLLDAGLVLFGEQGFDGVSTRALAKAAGVNQAAILYHFQSKEGLYLAVADAIVASVRPGLAPVLVDVRRRLDEQRVDAAQARVDIEAILLGLLREVLVRAADQQQCGIGSFMLREQLHPSPAFDILYRELLEPLHFTLSRLVALVRASDASEAGIIIEVQALLGQVIIFAAHRATLLRRLGRATLDADGMNAITDFMRTSLRRQFP